MHKWDYEGKFLERFEARWRGTIGDQVCRIIRDGRETVNEVVSAMQRKCEANFEERSGDFYKQLHTAIDTFDGRDFVHFLLRREALPYEEKMRLKEEARQKSAKAFMSHQPPTERQMTYLKSLGCNVLPKSKLEASELIDQWLRKK